METLKSIWQQLVKMFYSKRKLLLVFFVFSEVDVGVNVEMRHFLPFSHYFYMTPQKYCRGNAQIGGFN